MSSSFGICDLCGREVKRNFHHLLCRTVHRNKYFKKRFSKEEMKGRGLWLCRLCHRAVHQVIPDEKELSRLYNTKELLLTHEKIRQHVKWAKKQRIE